MLKKTHLSLIFALSAILFSCTHENIERRSTAQDPLWLKQIHDCMNRPVTKSSENEIRLMDYSLRAVISTQSDVDDAVNMIFNDDADIAIYEDGEYVITKVGLIKKEQEDVISKDEDFRNVIAPGMSLIDLEWSISGKEYHTVALASDMAGIIYDNIGTRILCPNPSESSYGLCSASIDSTGIDICPADSLDEGEVADTSDIITRDFYKSGTITAILGVEVFTYEISCSSSFDNSGILVDRKHHSISHATIGCKGDAQLKFDNGELFVSKYNEFSWAYAYGTSVSISVSPSGMGFTISGSTIGQESGSEVHRR